MLLKLRTVKALQCAHGHHHTRGSKTRALGCLLGIVYSISDEQIPITRNLYVKMSLVTN